MDHMLLEQAVHKDHIMFWWYTVQYPANKLHYLHPLKTIQTNKY